LGAFAQKTFLRRFLSPHHKPQLPPIFRLAPIPILRKIVPRVMAFGLWKVRVNDSPSSSAPATPSKGVFPKPHVAPSGSA
jgi:hypothetical protein